MRKLLSVCLAVVIVMLSFINVCAIDTVMYIEKLSPPANRLFDLPIYIKTEKTLAVSTFNIEYNPKKIEFRNALSDVENSKVKFKDKNGSVKVIFLCENGVNLKEKSKLLYIKFKCVDESGTSVKISAEDFVDSAAKNFTPPKSVVCKINENADEDADEDADGEDELSESEAREEAAAGGSYKNSNGRRKMGKKYRYKTRRSTNSRYNKDSNNDKNGFLGKLNTAGKNLNPSLLIIICFALTAFILTTAVMINLSLKSRKKKKTKKDGVI